MPIDSDEYFVYTLEEIDAVYQGTRCVFTMSEEGDTITVPFEEYDDTFEQIIKDVSIGTGVILIYVTVSVVSGVVTGIEMGDMDEALKVAALSSSESFKWGAITGVN